MKRFLRPLVVWTIGVMLGGLTLRAAELPDLWSERLKSVVAVEFYVETETDRRPALSYGTVIDRNGTIILPAAAIDSRISPSQLKEFKVHRPRRSSQRAGGVPGSGCPQRLALRPRWSENAERTDADHRFRGQGWEWDGAALGRRSLGHRSPQ